MNWQSRSPEGKPQIPGKAAGDLRAAASTGLQRAAEDEAMIVTSSVREAPSQKMKAVRPQAQAPYFRRQIKDRGKLGSGA